MKTVILAGGLGTRLSEETSKMPKPMLEIGDKPILWHIMRMYSYFGCHEFVICLGYKGDVIRDYFLNYNYNRDLTVTIGSTGTIIEYHNSHHAEWKVTLAETGAMTPTGGRIARIARYLSHHEPFMVTYGDGLANINLNELLHAHTTARKLATVTAVRPPSRFGEISVEEGTVVGFTEKPQLGRGWISGGFMVLNRHLADDIDPTKSLEEGLLTDLSSKKQLAIYQHNGAWGCVDTQRELQEMNNLWNSDKAFWKVW